MGGSAEIEVWIGMENWPTLYEKNLFKGPVIIYDRVGERSQMTFYGKYFRGPLDARRKTFAAHSTSHQRFSMPTLIGKNKHVL